MSNKTRPTSLYPPSGPIQLSWNYNYGYFSEEVLGDKDILLQNPDQVAQDGKTAFQTALWFWMTPQVTARNRIVQL